MFRVLILTLTLALSSCAEWRGAGRELGAAGKDLGADMKDFGVAVKHGATKAAKNLGKATQEAAHEVHEEIKK